MLAPCSARPTDVSRSRVSAAAKTSPDEDQLPREITRPCARCGHPESHPNPEWCRDRRKRAGITLTEMARIIHLHRKVSVQYLSQIERGEKAFPPWIAELYEKLFLRYTRAGDES